MLLQSGTSYNIQCIDIGADTTILHTQYTVQGKQFVIFIQTTNSQVEIYFVNILI